MARDDEDDDLYDEEFDFVDDEDEDDESPIDDESDLAEEAAAAARDKRRGRADDEGPFDEGADEERRAGEGRAVDEEVVDEYGRPEPAANYVVHIYEYRRFKRTVDRPFTPEDAEAFATEYNRTAKSYHRVAVAGKNDAPAKKSLD
jgi:hypothetical protein